MTTKTVPGDNQPAEVAYVNDMNELIILSQTTVQFERACVDFEAQLTVAVEDQTAAYTAEYGPSPHISLEIGFINLRTDDTQDLALQKWTWPSRVLTSLRFWKGL